MTKPGTTRWKHTAPASLTPSGPRVWLALGDDGTDRLLGVEHPEASEAEEVAGLAVAI